LCPLFFDLAKLSMTSALKSGMGFNSSSSTESSDGEGVQSFKYVFTPFAVKKRRSDSDVVTELVIII
jgi:hypothetical protein